MARTTIRTEDITASAVTSAKIAAGAVDTSGLEDDIALLGFRVASNGSLAKYNLVDQTIDDFQDASGVDASASTNETRDASGKYYSGAVAASGNYFGSGDLGTCTFGASSITQTGDTVAIDTVLSTGSESGGPGSSSYGDGVPNSSACYEGTVLSTVGTYDGDMWVANFDTLTIDASVTLTTNRPCRGMLIYVKNNCTINGALSMTARGGYANPTTSGGSDSAAVNASGLQLGMLTSGGSQTLAAPTFAGTGNTAVTAVANQPALSSDGTIFAVQRAGGAGGASMSAGTAGTTGAVSISSGGGGGGNFGGEPAYSAGSGAAGACFSGGGAGGSSRESDGLDAVAYGGAGGRATNNNTGGADETVAGGSGNPGGLGQTTSGVGGGTNSVTWQGLDGTGGLIWLVVGGDLTIGSGATVEVKGVDGKDGAKRSGSGSGGGNAMVLYAGTLTNNGSITALAGQNGNGTSYDGQDGGDGGVHNAQVSAGTYASTNNMTLISTTTAAQAAPTKGDIVLTYTNGAGTTTLDTDLTAEISADGGSTWTDLPLASEGSTGSHNIATSHDITIDSTITDPYNMAYRIKTLNQSVSKTTRIQAVSLGWS